MKHMWMILLAAMLLLGTALAEPVLVCPEITLAGNPTTGYSWAGTLDTESAIVEVEGGYVPAQLAEGMVGGGGAYRFVLRGLAAGEGVITFTYARSWETTAPLYELVCRVQVDDALNVTILGMNFDW